MNKLVITIAALALVAFPALASEATFQRTLSVNGRVDLTIATGSGNIHLVRGSDNQVHIFGRVKGNWGSSDDQVRQVAANPPIEQTGNIIRIGGHDQSYRNISISYEIQAPANAFLQASSGSGNITDDGIGDNARLSTGSGDIHAAGLQDGFTLGTGSGDIYAEQVGQGDVRAHTGSGTIELRNIRGGLRANTGSGNITVSGTPTFPWHLGTGSGNVEFSSGSSSFTLDASSGSGTVRADREMLTQGASNRHHLSGKIGGGGPTVRIRTGSGDIRIH